MADSIDRISLTKPACVPDNVWQAVLDVFDDNRLLNFLKAPEYYIQLFEKVIQAAVEVSHSRDTDALTEDFEADP
jgi:hypothetical protein